MNVLSIDYGLARVGTALGSTESGIAFARETYAQDQQLLPTLLELIRSESVEHIIIGRPYQRDGAEGHIFDLLEHFGKDLQDQTSCHVEYVDERYTSKIATGKMQEMGIKAKDQRGQLDAMAAQVMLQDWLDHQS